MNSCASDYEYVHGMDLREVTTDNCMYMCYLIELERDILKKCYLLSQIVSSLRHFSLLSLVGDNYMYLCSDACTKKSALLMTSFFGQHFH